MLISAFWMEGGREVFWREIVVWVYGGLVKEVVFFER